MRTTRRSSYAFLQFALHQTSTLTGAETFNLNVNYLRSEISANWSGFTGQINVNSNAGGADDFRLSGSVALNIPDARLLLMRFFFQLLLVVAPMIPIFHGVAAEQAGRAVTVIESPSTFTLENEFLRARVDRRTGRLISLYYSGQELLGGGGGYWSQVARGGSNFGNARMSSIRLSPYANGGERAEVACKFEYDNQSGNLPVNVEVRYALGRGDHWIYAYSVWEHPRGYPSFSVGEARYAMKLNPNLFDYLTVDAKRRRVMPSGDDWDRGTQLNLKEVRRLTTGQYAGQVEHKYAYSAVLADVPAYGWSSSKHGIGLWMINPSMEYIAGGPTKVELTGHLDVNKGGTPTLLNMWLGSHYGGSALTVQQDEAWSKFVGPFVIYCNVGKDHEAMWRDAQARAAKESANWPYSWISDRGYPAATERGTVNGQISIRDVGAANGPSGAVRIGLSAPDYQASPRRPLAIVDWQREGKFYQFWSTPDAQGRFQIRNVRPGRYTLHAFADGVLGEYHKANITVVAGQTLDLGSLVWIPERQGRQLWEIGIPNRSAEEFRHGDHYWQWGLYLRYQEEFPNDVNFVVGKSDWRKDWNYAQPPRIAPNGRVSDSVWRISFNLTELPPGPLILRLAFCGSRGGGRVSVAVNEQRVGDTGELPDTAVMHRDGIRGYWFERKITFDPSRLKIGTNEIQLRCHSTVWHQGVLYDYVRLEAAEEPLPTATPGT